MIQELIPVSIHKIMQTESYTALIIGTDQKHIAIYTEPHVGAYFQKHLSGEVHSRPLTCDTLNTILKGLDVKILQVVINHLQDTVYFARIFLEQAFGDMKQILEIDARPSDCLTLALINNVPLFCNKTLFDTAIPIEK
jgi:uncharacterized protein